MAGMHSMFAVLRGDNMARPRKTYPFDSIQPGGSRRFTVARYTSTELEQMLSALYRRRLADGSPQYSVITKRQGDRYVWVDVTHNGPVQEPHEVLQLTLEF